MRDSERETPPNIARTVTWTCVTTVDDWATRLEIHLLVHTSSILMVLATNQLP